MYPYECVLICVCVCVCVDKPLIKVPPLSRSLPSPLSSPLPPLSLPPLLSLLWFLLIGVWGGNYREGGSLGEVGKEAGGGEEEGGKMRRRRRRKKEQDCDERAAAEMRGGKHLFRRSSCWELTERCFLTWSLCTSTALMLFILLLVLHTFRKWRELTLVFVYSGFD